MRQPVPFGKYLLLDRISVGGMAEVFKAKSYGVEGFEKIIAIKRILPTMGEDRDFIKMFIDEAKIAGQLAHANICQIFELGRIDGSHFIAMEYIWGKDLLQIQNRLRKLKQPMPIPMACFIIAKTLEGLDYAHRKRDPLGRPLEIVHRDCSPQNVLVSYEGEVKVIDFGIAKATSRNSRTMAGVLKGKFGYMSPEQVRGLPLDRRSDLFALGTMLFECLTSERLFQGETDFSTLEKVRNVDIQMPRAVNPNIPEHIERVILKALAKDVDDRYQWCSEMLADLQQYLMSQDVVFTAKSLSSWLKEMFQPEIDRERQQLEQYKRVGRDGLIGGMPAAEAQKQMDVVEHLGDAGAPEGDATQLGGPSFEEIESGASVSGELGMPAAGRPAQPSPPQIQQQSARPPQPAKRAATDAEDGDFGEEAPTEIFGDLDQPAPAPVGGPMPPSLRGPTPPAAKAVPQRSTAAGPAALNRELVPPQQAPQQPRAPSSTTPLPAGPAPQPQMLQQPPQQQQPQAQPPPQQPQQPQQPQMLQQPPPPQGYDPNSGYGQPQQPYGYPQQPYAQQTTPPPGQQPPYPYPPQPMQSQNGMPQNGMPQNGQSMSGLAQHPQQGQAKTMIGQMAPTNVPGYGNQSGPYSGQMPQQSGQMSGQMPGQQGPQGSQGPHGQMPPPGAPYGYPQMPMSTNPSGQMQPPPQNPYEQYPQAGQLPSGYAQPPQHMGYGSQPPQTSPVTPVAPPRAKKKSTLVRDILIGVIIAVVALGGILAVKMLVLDGADDPGDGSGTAALATIRLSLPSGVKADLLVDGKKVATVADNQDVPLTAGHRKISLVAPTGRCEKDIDLVAGQTTPLTCDLAVGSGGGSGSGSGSAAAAVGSGSGSSGVALNGLNGSSTSNTPNGSGSGSGSGAGSGSGTATPVVAVKPTTPPPTPPVTPPTTPTPTPTKPVTPPTTPTKPVTPPTTPTKPPTTPDTGGADGTGYLTVISKPPAKIFVDGVSTGMTTPIGAGKLKLTAGKHKITFEVGGDKYTYPVSIRAGETTPLSKDLQ